DYDLIPQELLKCISCNCESGCNNQRCGCRKHGLKCTNLCSNCHENCSNTDKETFEEMSDSEEIIYEELATNRDVEFEDPEDVADYEDTSELESSIDEEEIRPKLKRQKTN
ncbi:hypothetical protein ALC57_10589, partial [Trachymyrmex cornetzi]